MTNDLANFKDRVRQHVATGVSSADAIELAIADDPALWSRIGEADRHPPAMIADRIRSATQLAARATPRAGELNTVTPTPEYRRLVNELLEVGVPGETVDAVAMLLDPREYTRGLAVSADRRSLIEDGIIRHGSTPLAEKLEVLR